MKRILAIIIVFLFPHLSISQSSSRLRIAIMDFSAKGISQSFSEGVSELLRVEFINSNKFIIIERTQTEKILREQGFQQTGCTDLSCAVEIGRLLSAQKILIGTVIKVENSIIISGRLIDVERGTGEVAEAYSFENKGELKNAVNTFSDNLIKKIFFPPGSVTIGKTHCGCRRSEIPPDYKSYHYEDPGVDKNKKYRYQRNASDIQPGSKMVIKEIQIQSGMSKFNSIGKQIKNYLSEIFIERGSFSIVPDDELRNAEDSLKFSPECFTLKINNVCMKKILKKTNADYILYGTISYDQDRYSLTIKVMNSKGKLVRYKTILFHDMMLSEKLSRDLADYIESGKAIEKDTYSGERAR